MFPLTLSEFQQLTQCRFTGDVRSDLLVTGAAIDSRQIRSGDIFVALPGESHHGLEFACDAIAAGCSIVLTSVSCLRQRSPIPEDDTQQLPIAVVDNAIAALQAVAAWNRQQSGADVIAITGSVGKTTTRGLIASVLRQAGPTVESPHNYNNQLGVPLTLLQISPEHRFAVVEIGSSAPGEIARLAALVQPTHAVITRITAAHLKGLKTIELVADEKLSLLDHLTEGGTAWLNADDDILSTLAVESLPVASPSRRMEFDLGWKPKPRRPPNIRMVSGGKSIAPRQQLNPLELCITVDNTTFTAPVLGRHNACAVRTAIELGQHFGLSKEAIQTGLNTYRGQPGRCEIIETPFGHIIDDTYNASPASVEAAIQLVSNWPDVDRRILILGDMLDLGPNARQIHADIGISISHSRADTVWLAGTASQSTAEAIRSSPPPQPDVHWFPAVDELLDELSTQAATGTFRIPPKQTTAASDVPAVILVKGSRAMCMERVVKLLGEFQRITSASG